MLWRMAVSSPSGQWRTKGRVLGVQTPLPLKFRRPSKIVQNSTRLWKLLKIAWFGTPTLQDVRKKGSKILKLPSVSSCFTLAMTNKFVVIINSLKVPKIKKILLYEMKFLVPSYSCIQNPWLPPLDPLSVCPQVLKYQKLRNLYYMKRNFLYQITAASRSTGYRSQIPFLSVLCPQLNLLNPPRTKSLGTPLQTTDTWRR